MNIDKKFLKLIECEILFFSWSCWNDIIIMRNKLYIYPSTFCLACSFYSSFRSETLERNNSTKFFTIIIWISCIKNNKISFFYIKLSISLSEILFTSKSNGRDFKNWESDRKSFFVSKSTPGKSDFTFFSISSHEITP